MFDKDMGSVSEQHPQLVHAIIDRPLGTAHPNYPDMIYPLNYGYIEGILAADGAWQDVYVMGVQEACSDFYGVHIATIHRLDDVEDKWVLAPEGMRFSLEEIRAAVDFTECYYHSEIVLHI